MEVIELELSKLKPYENNAKTHPKEQVQLIANSIKEFGFRTPILVDEDFIIIQGHGRRLASIELGLKSIPCVIADNLSKEQVKMLRLADNKVAESEWDIPLLDIELLGLGEFFELEDFGFELDNDEEAPVTDLSGEVGESYEIIIECDGELNQEELYYRFIEEGLKCRTSTL